MELFKLFGKIAVKNDEANRNIDETTGKAEGSSNKVVSAFKSIAAAAATYLSAKAVIDFGKSCVNAASDVQEMENKFGVVFGDLSTDVDAWATDFAGAIGRNKNTIKTYLADNQNMFVGMGMTREEGAKLSEQMVSLGLDLASFNNLSEPDAVNALSNALMGETESAKSLGAVLNENTIAMAMEKMGIEGKFEALSEAEKMEVRYQAILMQSQDAIGDCERSMGSYKSTTIELQSAKEQLQETIGGYLLPAMTKFTAAMVTGVRWVQSMVEWLAQHKAVAAGVAVVIGISTAAIILQNTVQAVKAAMNAAEATSLGALIAAKLADAAATMAALAPYLLIVAAIAAVVAIIVVCVKHLDQIKAKTVEVFNIIKETITNAMNTVASFLSGIWNNIVSAATNAWNTIKNVVQVGLQLIGQIISAAFQIITIPFRFIWENCKDTITYVWNSIKSVVSSAINAVKSVITSVMNAVKSVVSSVMNAIKSVFSTVWNSIKSVVTTVMNSIKSVISSVMNAVKSVFSSAWNGIKSTVSGAINGVKSVISSGLNGAKSTVTSVLNGIKNAFSNAMNSAKNVVGNAISAIKSKFNFSWSLPKLKLPHPKISGSFSLNPPSVPKFSIDWYNKAVDTPYMFTEPTVFNYGGSFKGAGETSDEIMYGHDNLMRDIRTAAYEATGNMVDRLISILGKILDLLAEYIPELANMQLVTDTGALVGELAPKMDDELGKRMNHKERGN